MTTERQSLLRLRRSASGLTAVGLALLLTCGGAPTKAELAVASSEGEAPGAFLTDARVLARLVRERSNAGAPITVIESRDGTLEEHSFVYRAPADWSDPGVIVAHLEAQARRRAGEVQDPLPFEALVPRHPVSVPPGPRVARPDRDAAERVDGASLAKLLGLTESGASNARVGRSWSYDPASRAVHIRSRFAGRDTSSALLSRRLPRGVEYAGDLCTVLTALSNAVDRPGESVASMCMALTGGPFARAATLKGTTDGAMTLGQLVAKLVQEAKLVATIRLVTMRDAHQGAAPSSNVLVRWELDVRLP